MRLLRVLIVPLLAVWLAVWLVLSWPAIQDDALIHLRYADFLYARHFVTFDGVHPSFGASSLLYVALLALLRGFTASPLLSRAVSSVFHVVLFLGVAAFYLKNRRGTSTRVQLLLMAIMLLLVAPSSVRWLDDGMETGFVLCLVCMLVAQTHRLSQLARVGSADYVVSIAIGFLLVGLRIELATAALFASLILVLATAKLGSLRSLAANAHFVIGAVVAAIVIRLLMHSFLPDTALAKSHGFGGFNGSLRAAATVLTGALLFGLGTMTLWLISAWMVLRNAAARRLPTLAANAVFPFVLAAAAVRGQEIQGARYLVWCFFFSIVWNLLELRRLDAISTDATSPEAAPTARGLAVFLICFAAVLPFESHWMYRVLSTRAHTMRDFMASNMAPSLQTQQGVAADVGYISYFSQGNMCDLSGLVNGRADARLSTGERLKNCAAQSPRFALLNTSQTYGLAEHLDISRWEICGEYDFANLRDPDRHYLLVAPELADATCRASGTTPLPESAALVQATYP